MQPVAVHIRRNIEFSMSQLYQVRAEQQQQQIKPLNKANA